MMQLLLKAGADPGAPDLDGETPEAKAASMGSALPSLTGAVPWPLWEPEAHALYPAPFRQKAPPPAAKSPAAPLTPLLVAAGRDPHRVRCAL